MEADMKIKRKPASMERPVCESCVRPIHKEEKIVLLSNRILHKNCAEHGKEALSEEIVLKTVPIGKQVRV